MINLNEYDSLDLLVKQALESKIEEIEVPAMDDVWDEIEKHLDKKYHRLEVFLYINKHKKVFIGTVAAIVIGIIIFIPSEGDSKFTRILNYATQLKENIVSIDFDNKIETMDNIKTNDDLSMQILEQELTLAQLKEYPNLAIKIPKYIPDSYSFKKGVIKESNNRFMLAEITYVSSEGKTLLLKQEPIV